MKKFIESYLDEKFPRDLFITLLITVCMFMAGLDRKTITLLIVISLIIDPIKYYYIEYKNREF
jgi:hypothetical protein